MTVYAVNMSIRFYIGWPRFRTIDLYVLFWDRTEFWNQLLQHLPFNWFQCQYYFSLSFEAFIERKRLRSSYPHQPAFLCTFYNFCSYHNCHSYDRKAYFFSKKPQSFCEKVRCVVQIRQFQRHTAYQLILRWLQFYFFHFHQYWRNTM